MTHPQRKGRDFMARELIDFFEKCVGKKATELDKDILYLLIDNKGVIIHD